MEEGSVVAALAGMALVMVGIFQFLKGYITSSNQDYLALRKKYEDTQAKVVELEKNNLIWKNRAIITQENNKELRRKLADCTDTIQSALNKTRPLPDLSALDEDETIIPIIEEELKKD